MKVVGGLEYLHGRGYVVGDLNPSNIIVSNDLSTVKICDLDNVIKIGDPLKPRKRYDEITSIAGKRTMPPEVIIDEKKIESGNINYKVDETLDIYALGTCLLYMLTGKEGMKWNVFDHVNEREYEEGLQRRIQEIKTDDKWLESQLSDNILVALLDFDKKKRIVTVKDLRAELDILEKNFK